MESRPAIRCFGDIPKDPRRKENLFASRRSFFLHRETSNGLCLKADKIVDGQPVTMATIECSYDGGNRTLQCALP
jgi:hypothetical protein